jgi:hypothetical protein
LQASWAALAQNRKGLSGHGRRAPALASFAVGRQQRTIRQIAQDVPQRSQRVFSKYNSWLQC